MHQEFVDACLEEVRQAFVGNLEGVGEVEGKACDVGPEEELLLLIVRIGNGVASTGVGEGGAVNVCHVAHPGQEKGNLYVLAAVTSKFPRGETVYFFPLGETDGEADGACICPVLSSYLSQSV